MVFWEKYYPLLLSILVTSVIFLTGCLVDRQQFILQLADNSLTISITLIGFFLTILTLVNSIDSTRMRHIKQRGLFPRLLSYLKVSINVNLLLLVGAFLIKFVSHQEYLNIKGKNLFDYGFFWLFAFTLLISFRFIKIFVMLMSSPDKKQPA